MAIPGGRRWWVHRRVVGGVALVVLVAAVATATVLRLVDDGGSGHRAEPGAAGRSVTEADGQGLAAGLDRGTAACVAWVSTSGSDDGDGTERHPWASISHAVEAVPDGGCTILVAPGRYDGRVDIDRRFDRPVTVRSAEPHLAELVHDETVLKLDGARRVVIEGFRLRHDGPGATGYVAIADIGDGEWSRDVTLRGNIFHDSYDDDLLKVHNGVAGVVIEGNVFYNQGPNEQHIDVNSAVDVTIRGNVFFNDHDRSGREVDGSKAFIVVKDSGGDTDGNLGARDIAIERNVFLNWEGGRETLIQVGNDGMGYHEAIGVRVESNLFLGNTDHETVAPLGIRGARGVVFNANTVVGDLPGTAAALWVNRKGDNPRNEDVVLTNNIWSDPTGTMSAFSTGSASSVRDLVLERNLYWNGGEPLPDGEVIGPSDDPGLVQGDPEVAGSSPVVVPYWTGSSFLSGSTSIGDEVQRLVEAHGRIGAGSAAIDAADPVTAPRTDILGRRRDRLPDLGAYEAGGAEAAAGG